MKSISKFFICVCMAFTASCGEISTDKQVSNETGAPNLKETVRKLTSDAGLYGVVLVAKGDKTILSQGFGLQNIELDTPTKVDTKFVIASMTKSFTAVLVMQLVEDGKLSLDDTLAQHLPTYNADYSERVTVRQMLQNRSGIPHTIAIPGWFDNDYKSSLTDDKFLEEMAALPLSFEPDADYLYSNINYYLLGLIIDKVTGQPYESVLEGRILAPLGMDNTGQLYDASQQQNFAKNYMKQEDGTLKPVPIVNPKLFRATASQYSTAQDLLKWNIWLQGNASISDTSKAIIFDPEKPMAWAVGEIPLREDATPSSVVTYNGEMAGYTSIISYFPDYDGTVIILNNNNTDYNTLLRMTLEIAAEAYASK